MFKKHLLRDEIKRKLLKFSCCYDRVFLKLTSWRLNVYYELTLVHKTLSSIIQRIVDARWSWFRNANITLFHSFSKESIFYPLHSHLCYMVKQYRCTMPGLKRITVSLPHIEDARYRCWIDKSEWHDCVSSLYVLSLFSQVCKFFSFLAKNWCSIEAPEKWKNRMQPFLYHDRYNCTYIQSYQQLYSFIFSYVLSS